MAKWSLPKLLEALHDDIQQKLGTARRVLGHPGTKGDASEDIWLKLFGAYLPERYRVEKAFVVDSDGKFSEQLDVVIFDRQYSPFIFRLGDQMIIPAESVYAVFEAKQSIDAAYVDYAENKITSVRSLNRTSLPIPHAGGTFPAKSLTPIIGGILTFESQWTPPLGDPLKDALSSTIGDDCLDMGCVAAHGSFFLDRKTGGYEFLIGGKPATTFLFRLISQLQFSGTVPMIDINAYAKWLE